MFSSSSVEQSVLAPSHTCDGKMHSFGSAGFPQNTRGGKNRNWQFDGSGRTTKILRKRNGTFKSR